MGGIIGGIIGGVGNIIAANAQAQAAREATQAALTGYNYLTTGPGAAPTQAIIQRGTAAGDRMGALLGLGGDQGAARQAFDNYLNSTGYQFRLGQGTDAIAGNAAARGLLHSGATARALTEYGQNLASGEFQNYLAQLGGLQTAGQNALGQVATVGAASGGGAANAIIQGGNAMAGGITGAASNFGNALSQIFQPRTGTAGFPAAPAAPTYGGGLY